jgi:hypothetical protein
MKSKLRIKPIKCEEPIQTALGQPFKEGWYLTKINGSWVKNYYHKVGGFEISSLQPIVEWKRI